MRTVLTRVLALALAVGMVVLALRLKDDRDGPIIGNGDPATLRLVCAPEVRDACLSLADADSKVKVTIEEAGETAADFAASDGADVAFDGWLVPGPWPELVAHERDSAGREPILGAPTTLARSPLVITIWEERAPFLADDCGGEITWICIGEAATGTWEDIGGPPGWGPVEPAHEDPTVSASGLLAVAHATTSFFGHTDYSRANLEGGDYAAWLRGLEDAVPEHDTPLENMLRFGPADVDLVGGIEAEIRNLIEGSARADQLDVIQSEPAAYAEALFVPVAGAPGAMALERQIIADAAEYFASTGWRPHPPDPSEPDTTGLPSASVVGALRGFWEETQR